MQLLLNKRHSRSRHDFFYITKLSINHQSHQPMCINTKIYQTFRQRIIKFNNYQTNTHKLQMTSSSVLQYHSFLLYSFLIIFTCRTQFQCLSITYCCHIIFCGLKVFIAFCFEVRCSFLTLILLVNEIYYYYYYYYYYYFYYNYHYHYHYY